MTRSLRRRAAFTLIVTAWMVAAGVALGYCLGYLLIMHAKTNALAQDAQVFESRSAAYLLETFGLLARMDKLGYAPCSTEEMAYYREQVLRAEYIRDIGSVVDGQVRCSALMGVVNGGVAFPQGGHIDSEGGYAYLSTQRVPPMLEKDWDNHGILLGHHYVLLSNYIYQGLVPPEIHVVRNASFISAQDLKLTWGVVPAVDLGRLGADGAFVQNAELYVTRCTAGRQSCTTVFTSLPRLLRAERGQMLICLYAGGLLGLLAGLYCSVIFQRSLGMDRQLRRAIARGRIQVLYQPIVDLTSGRMAKAEALARWTDEDGFAVSPDVFVSLAESGRFVGQLTELVVRRALTELRELLQADEEFQVSVNVTAADLCDERFLPMLEAALRESGVPARQLAIEVTESSTAKAQRARQTINELRERGHTVEIDDFGTGYSSLSYLNELQVDAIKIDRSFTQAIVTKSVTALILPQILAMADTLGLLVIAEGIEVPEQAEYYGCAAVKVLGQGWLFGRPGPAATLLERWQQERGIACSSGAGGAG